MGNDHLYTPEPVKRGSPYYPGLEYIKIIAALTIIPLLFPVQVQPFVNFASLLALCSLTFLKMKKKISQSIGSIFAICFVAICIYHSGLEAALAGLLAMALMIIPLPGIKLLKFFSKISFLPYLINEDCSYR